MEKIVQLTVADVPAFAIRQRLYVFLRPAAIEKGRHFKYYLPRRIEVSGYFRPFHIMCKCAHIAFLQEQILVRYLPFRQQESVLSNDLAFKALGYFRRSGG